jgi:hypothetical protein
MPNWVHNQLQILGNDADVEHCLDAIKGDKRALDFEQIVPIPASVERPKDAMSDASALLYWRVDNWGTKWNACDHLDGVTDCYPEGAMIRFDTAWSPPLAVLLALSKKFPSLEIELHWTSAESGYQGMARYVGGEEKFAVQINLLLLPIREPKAQLQSVTVGEREPVAQDDTESLEEVPF